MVMGGDSCSEGRGFESQHHILDEHFFTLICCKNSNVCLKRQRDKKEVGMANFFKKPEQKHKTIGNNISNQEVALSLSILTFIKLVLSIHLITFNWLHFSNPLCTFQFIIVMLLMNLSDVTYNILIILFASIINQFQINKEVLYSNSIDVTSAYLFCAERFYKSHFSMVLSRSTQS